MTVKERLLLFIFGLTSLALWEGIRKVGRKKPFNNTITVKRKKGKGRKGRLAAEAFLPSQSLSIYMEKEREIALMPKVSEKRNAPIVTMRECVCVCVRERERERASLFVPLSLSAAWPIPEISPVFFPPNPFGRCFSCSSRRPQQRPRRPRRQQQQQRPRTSGSGSSGSSIDGIWNCLPRSSAVSTEEETIEEKRKKKKNLLPFSFRSERRNFDLFPPRSLFLSFSFVSIREKKKER